MTHEGDVGQQHERSEVTRGYWFQKYSADQFEDEGFIQLTGFQGAMKENRSLAPFVLNLANGIIGVSILAMPFCFKECGILLALVLLLITNVLTRWSCYMLIKGAYLARRKSYETLALDSLGSSGKILVEVFTVLFLISTLVAFFIIIGDLGPSVISRLISADRVNHDRLRMVVMLFTACVVILPLCLLRNVDSLVHFSSMAIVFYGILVIRLAFACIPRLQEQEWLSKIDWWNNGGILKSLPIFALSLSCQTQLFVLYESLPDPNPDKMDIVSSRAIHLCSLVYASTFIAKMFLEFLSYAVFFVIVFWIGDVGLFGYIGFIEQTIPGDILLLLDSTSSTQIIKLLFILSVSVSFPLMIFPCRAAIYSFYKSSYRTAHEMACELIPDSAFKSITVFLILLNFAIAVVIPNVELVLSLTGSLIGSIICFVLPGGLFLIALNRSLEYQLAPFDRDSVLMKLCAKATIAFGLFTLVACSYGTLMQNSNSRETALLPLATTEVSLKTDALVPPLPVPLRESLDGEANAKSELRQLEEVGRKEPPIPYDDTDIKKRGHEISDDKSKHSHENVLVDSGAPGQPVEANLKPKITLATTKTESNAETSKENNGQDIALSDDADAA